MILYLKSLVLVDSGSGNTEVRNDYREADKERGKEEKEAKRYHPELGI